MHMASSQVWQRTHRTYVSTSLHVRMQSTDLTLIQVHLSHIPGVPIAYRWQYEPDVDHPSRITRDL